MSKAGCIVGGCDLDQWMTNMPDMTPELMNEIASLSARIVDGGKWTDEELQHAVDAIRIERSQYKPKTKAIKVDGDEALKDLFA